MTPPSPLSNYDIARHFEKIADILEIQGENAFKVRAYRSAARTILDLDDDLRDIAARDALGDLPGFGPAIIAKTRDFLDQGTTKLWDEVKDAVPAGVVQIASVPGIGPKTAKALWDALGITSVEELEHAARAEKLRSVSGFGPAKEQKIIEAIERSRRLTERLPLYIARPYAERLVAALAQLPEVEQAEIGGSLRRCQDTVGDIDLVVATSDPGAVQAAVPRLPGITDVFESGDAKISMLSEIGLRVDIRIGKPDDFGALLHHFSSGREHNRQLREYAEKRGLKINEYGVFDAKTNAERVGGKQEDEIYAALDLPFIPLELREGHDEIELAAQNRLPHLISLADFRGQLHEHTTYSDGKATIREMAEAALARGYEFLAITDHSVSLAIANGLSRDRLLQQLDEIAGLNKEFVPRGLTLLTGIEADILADGSLDCENDLLARLDIVVGSVHIRHRENAEQMTRRIITALENPHLTILGHPTGRLLGRREPFAVHMDRVIEAAAKNQKVLEINSAPERMDLNDTYARRAKQAGVLLTINADAHSVAGLDLLPWGLCMARRAGLEAADVINTFSLDTLRAQVCPARSAG